MSNEKKTELEQALALNATYAFVRGVGGGREEIQSVLDRIGPEICKEVGAAFLVEHTRIVYERTAGMYAKDPKHKDISDGLISFMNYLSDGEQVLDLGCGPLLRDALFMSLPDEQFRSSYMGRIKDGRPMRMRISIPAQSFRVTAVDGSRSVVRHALATAMSATDIIEDRRVKEKMSIDILDGDMHDCASLGEQPFDGVWSSAALFMHTPQELLRPALEHVASVIKSGGIFGVSYANNSAGLSYDNLRLSSTRAIKYFSRPTPTQIASLAESAGFLLREEQFDDFETGGVLKKNFFIVQFFQKR